MKFKVGDKVKVNNTTMMPKYVGRVGKVIDCFAPLPHDEGYTVEFKGGKSGSFIVSFTVSSLDLVEKSAFQIALQEEKQIILSQE